MKRHIESTLDCYKSGLLTKDEAVNQILYLKAESEIGASDATEPKHGTYAVDGNSECEADSTATSEQTSSAAMETRIDSEKTCEHEWNMNMLSGGGMTITCMKCGIDRSQV